jgi:hypothetical protein
MKPSYVVPTPLLEQVKLGRLVTNIWMPSDVYYDPAPSVSRSPTQIQQVTQYSSTIHFRTSSKSSVYLRLLKLFGIRRDRNANVSMKVEAEGVTTETLSNYADVFRSMWRGESPEGNSEKEADVINPLREWVQDRLESDEEVYMITGVKMATNAKITVETSLDTSTSLTPGLQLPSNGTSGDPQAIMIAIKLRRSYGIEEKYEVKGTCVVALQYCKLNVAKRWMGKNAQEVVSVGNNSWEWLAAAKRTITSDITPRNRLIVEVSLGEPVDSSGMARVDEEGQDSDDEDRVYCYRVGDVELIF